MAEKTLSAFTNRRPKRGSPYFEIFFKISPPALPNSRFFASHRAKRPIKETETIIIAVIIFFSRNAKTTKSPNFDFFPELLDCLLNYTTNRKFRIPDKTLLQKDLIGKVRLKLAL